MRRSLGLAAAAVCLCGAPCEAARRLRRPDLHYEKPKEELQEQHKYLLMGEELDRPPNVFDVNGQQQALPEVPGLVDYSPQAFADAADVQAEAELRTSRAWGRVYVDGWPSSMQYMRGSFGGPPPLGLVDLIAAEPQLACEELTNQEAVKGKIVLAGRGVCTFGTKAKVAQAAGAAGLLIVNSEDGNRHPPMPDATDVALFVGMVPKPAGMVLLQAARSAAAPLRARVVPVNCHPTGLALSGGDGKECQPATAEERDAIAQRVLGGRLALNAPDAAATQVFEYLLADFGTGPPAGAMKLTAALPLHACNPLENAEAVRGTAVLVQRGGGCDFVSKAAQLSAAGAGAMLLFGLPSQVPFVMGAQPAWRGAGVAFPVVAIGGESGAALLQATQQSVGSAAAGPSVTLTADAGVTAQAWRDLERFRAEGEWPRGRDARAALLLRLRAEHAGHPERLALLDAAFAATEGPGSGGVTAVA